MSEPRRLILIRHGRVDFTSRDFRVTPRGRQWNPPLSERGREQAELLAAGLLAMARPSAFYCSPFRRCLETAAPFATAASLQPAIEEDIGEVFLGEWEGESFEAILSSDEEAARRFRDREPLWSLSPGGEDGLSFQARVVTAVESFLDAHPRGDVLVITHGGVINAYVMKVLGIKDQDMLFGPENTSLNIVHVQGGDRRVRFIDDVSHLTDPTVFQRDARSAP